MELYLIRHTKVALSEPTCYGQTDVDVCSTFLEEAALTKKRLSGVTFDKVYSSPYRRALKLAAYCGYPDAQTDNRLKEMSMGEWEMRPFSLIPEAHIDEWYSHFIDIKMPGGESTRDVIRRMQSFFFELRTQPYSRVAIFYHGCAILCTRILFGDLPETAGFNDVTDFGGVQVLTI
ncbi:MAG: histidine phosphatase family protein [Bacteroidaceae bacterium]|nr:histidine phosphatase family protein [Bacteroidaceae bacterium]